jgi:putative Holliday junction resolvase
MSRNFLGIDHGDRRTGLAQGSDLGLAFPLQAIVAKAQAEALDHIAGEIKRYRITEIVVGYPLNMDGTPGARTRIVDAFIVELEARFQLPVHRVDEGLSSVEAEATFSPRQRGRSVPANRRHRATGELDSRAAAIILQDFLNAQGFGLGNAG